MPGVCSLADALCVWCALWLLWLCFQIISMQGWSEILFYTQMSMGREVRGHTPTYTNSLRGHKLEIHALRGRKLDSRFEGVRTSTHFSSDRRPIKSYRIGSSSIARSSILSCLDKPASPLIFVSDVLNVERLDRRW